MHPFSPQDIANSGLSGAGGVDQANYNDCVFEASLAALATTTSGQAAIAQMIVRDLDGSYTVTFPGDAQHPVTVTQSDLTAARVSDSATWADILEAALLNSDPGFANDAQLPPNATGSADGSPPTPAQYALYLLTGNLASKDVASSPNIGKEINRALGNNQPVVACCCNDDHRALVSGHEWTIMACDPQGNQITLRNPWGSFGNSGTMQDGVTDEGNGEVTMSLEIFSQNYGEVTFGNVVVLNWRGLSSLGGLVGDLDGDGKDEIFVSSPWGVGILQQSVTTMISLTTTGYGTRLAGGWLIEAGNVFGPVGDYDFDGQDEILSRSSWGLCYLKLKAGALTSIALTPNGTDLAKTDSTTPDTPVLLNALKDTFGPVFNPDGQTTCLFYTNSAGIGSVSFQESPLCHLCNGIYRWGSNFDGWNLDKGDIFGPIGDFNASGQRDQIFVSGPSGIAIIAVGYEWSTITQAANGTALPGGWTLDTKTNHFCAGGIRTPSADSGPNPIPYTPSLDVILVTSPWGIGYLWLGWAQNATGVVTAPNSTNALVAEGSVRNGTDLNGWKLDTRVNEFGPTAYSATRVPSSHYLYRTPSFVVVTGPQGLATLTRLLQLTEFSFKTIKYWSGFADDCRSKTLKCSANT